MDRKAEHFPASERPRRGVRGRVLAAVGLSLFGVGTLLSGADRRVLGPPQDSLPATPWSWLNIQPSRTLQWHECFEDGGYECARLDVPMDWQDPTDEKRVVLAVARIRATRTDDYRGPVIFNPGGPGGSGVFALRDRGKYLQGIVGENHDIISFDPRGVGASTPRHQCFASPQDEHTWELQEPGVIGAHSNIIPELHARGTAYSQMCEASMAGTGLLEHAGSVAIARDMLEIVNQAGHDGLLRYWGFSWGTILGGIFAAMYPEKVGRLVSDGNVDYREWFRSEHRNFLHDTEKVMDAFYTSCHEAGPAKCALHGPDPEGIKARLDALFESLKMKPVVAYPAASMPVMVTNSKLRVLQYSTLYQPLSLFASFATIAEALERGDAMPFYQHYAPADGDDPSPSLCGAPPLTPFDPLPDIVEGNKDAFSAIRCADHSLPALSNVTLDDVRRDVDEMLRWSPSTGALNALHSLVCVGRTTEPKWTFEGAFGGHTRHPILFVANMADNITPLVSARNNSAGFPGSVVLVQKSYGHTSLAAPSDCTKAHVHEYFQNGTLPDAGAECDGPWGPFDGKVATFGSTWWM